MICPFCHQSVPDGNRFCTKCGSRIPACPSCGKPVLRPTKFCTGCGTALPESVLALFTPVPSEPAPEAPENTAAIAAEIHKSINEESRDIPSAPPVKKHFCTRCGAACPPGQKLCDACLAKQAEAARPKSFCVRCGTPVAEGETLCPECRVAAAKERRSVSEASYHKSLFAPILIGICAALLLIVGGIAFWALTNRSSDTNADVSITAETYQEDDAAEGNDVSTEEASPAEAPDTSVSDEGTSEEAEEPAEEVPEETAPAAEEAPSEDPAAEEAVPESDPVENDPDSVEAMGKVDYFIQHCNDIYFDADYFEGFTKEEARIALNGIYARCGRSFDDTELTNYYKEHFDWYDPTISPKEWKDSYFNSYESANQQILVDYSVRMGYRKG